MGIDYYQLGIETGKMAAKILKGEEKASETPYITAVSYTHLDVYKRQVMIPSPAETVTMILV